MRGLGWLVVLAAVIGAGYVLGVPHLRSSYEFLAKNYDPMADRYYLKCWYYGPYGWFEIRPADGKCTLFKLWRGV